MPRVAAKTVTTVTSKRPLDARKAALLDEFKDFPGIKVLERRFDNPDMPGSVDIRLKDELTHSEDPAGKKRLWYLRWIDGKQEGRYSTITAGLGYVPVKVAELQNAEHVTDLAD